MFWKKKKTKGDDPFGLEFEEGPRYYFRVCPAPDRPVTFQVGGKVYPVEDISAGGFALHAEGVAPGQQVPGLLSLPGADKPIPVVVTVRGVSPHGLVGTEFAKIREGDQELIHLYVLARQKEEIEQRKREGKVES